VTLGGWVPAMRITENGIPPGIEPYNAPELIDVVLQGTGRKWNCHSTSPARRRAAKRDQ
jgi:hypothetical protein